MKSLLSGVVLSLASIGAQAADPSLYAKIEELAKKSPNTYTMIVMVCYYDENNTDLCLPPMVLTSVQTDTSAECDMIRYRDTGGILKKMEGRLKAKGVARFVSVGSQCETNAVAAKLSQGT